jgi:hypothetical protein
MKEKLLNWLNLVLVANVFFVFFGFAWLAIAAIGDAAGVNLGLDLWNQLLPLMVIIASLYFIALLITLISAYLSTMRFLSLKATSNFA